MELHEPKLRRRPSLRAVSDPTGAASGQKWSESQRTKFHGDDENL